MNQTRIRTSLFQPADPCLGRPFGSLLWPLLCCTLLVLALGLVSCDTGSPIAPEGSQLSVSAAPTRITLNGTSQIRVVARKPNGTPLNPGTIILFTTSIGTIPASVPLDEAGEALTLLTGNGQFGIATVTASTGSTEGVSVDVQVGLPAASLSLQATPSSVGELGGGLSLLALVRDDQGQPLAEAKVNFSSEIGSLASGGALVETDSNGTAVDDLTVSEADIDSIRGDTFTVEVEVGSGTGSLLSANETIFVRRLPDAAFSFGINTLTVVFTDTSLGNPTRWNWNFGDGNTSELQNPAHTYAGADTYQVTLRVTNSQGSDELSQFVIVTGQ